MAEQGGEMAGYVFDPGRLARSPKQQERDGYALAGRLLRDYIGGDPLAEVRRRCQTDPRMRRLLDELRHELDKAVRAVDEELRRRAEAIDRALTAPAT